MMKKLLVILMVFVFLVPAFAQTVQSKKKVNAKPAIKKTAIKKIPAKKPVAVKAVPKAVVQAPEPEDKLGDLREDMNKALADLKGQVEKIKSDNSDAKVGGAIFFRWQNHTQNGGTSVNNFDVDRAYLDFKKKLAGGANARITLDVARQVAPNTQQLFDYLKYAYVEIPVGIPSSLQIVPFELNAKIGLQHTVWIDWADKILNLRYIAKTIIDNEGVMSSADFGLGAFGKITLPYLPDIEYQATVLNGTGYKATETDGKKAVGVRVNTTAFDGGDAGKVITGVFVNVAGVDSSLSMNGSDKLAGGLIAYKHDLGTADIEYFRGTNKNGYSIGGVYSLGSLINFLPGLGVFARLDSYDPSMTKANDQLDRSFYGATYDINKDIKLAMDMQNVTGGSAASTSAGKTTSIFYLHSMVQL